MTSFQLEGMVLIDLAVRLSPSIRVITIDTGRLPGETYDVIEAVRARYRIPVEVVLPDAAEVSSMVTRFGPNLFLEAREYRSLCCEIRKVRPMARRLAGLSAYAVGLRRSHSEQREQVAKGIEVDGRFKLSPLADWTDDMLQQYVRENNLPQHPLYARGYRSIGCAPCTRAVQPGEDDRAGRWWWEDDPTKECGLHFEPDGRVRRKVDVMLSEVLVP